MVTTPVDGEGRRWGRGERPGVDHARAASPWSMAGPEPSVDEALDDPIVRLVLRRDGLTAEDVRAAIRAPARLVRRLTETVAGR